MYYYRFIGGAAHGQRMRIPLLTERMEFTPSLDGANPFVGRIRECYFLVRLRERRGILLAESLLADPRVSSRHLFIGRVVSLRIMADHADYAVCEGCEGLIPLALAVRGCPRCHSYRLDSSFDRIATSAERYAERPACWTLPSFDL